MRRCRHLIALITMFSCIGQVSAEQETSLTPFLQRHCVECHGLDTQEADLRLDLAGRSQSPAETAEMWHAVRERVLSGEMPPKDSIQPTDDVRREEQRILADEEIEKPRILRLFQEYFGYTAAPSVFKDDHIIREAGFQKYYPERLVEDTDRLVLHILKTD